MRNTRDGVPTTRFLSEADCRRIAATVNNEAKRDGGAVRMAIGSTWRSTVRWAKNEITDSTDERFVHIEFLRDERGRESRVEINQVDDAELRDGVLRAERLLALAPATGRSGTETKTFFPDEPFPQTKIWSDATYNLDTTRRAATMRELVAPARAAGMHSFGYIQTSAEGSSIVDSRGRVLYYPKTTAEYRVTVRDPAGTGSGWAGQTFSDWNRIDTAKLSAIALDKCLRSRNPVVVEPGRYTVILEPQAAGLILQGLFIQGEGNTSSGRGWFHDHLGKRVVDERLTFSQDPFDPDTDMFPFDDDGEPMRKTVWIDHGVVRAEPYSRDYAVTKLGRDVGQPLTNSIRMSGGETSVEEMIATTKRGLLVTRFSNISKIFEDGLLYTGYTRDGLWLIENGKISKPVKNLRFTESPLFVLNNIEQLGTPVRVDGTYVVPPIKAHDFSFTALTDAI